MSNGFCSKFHTLSSSAKILKLSLGFDKVTEIVKVGTFFETQCILHLYSHKIVYKQNRQANKREAQG